MGDTNIVYNPNYPMDFASYLTSINELGFYEMMDEIIQTALTVRARDNLAPHWFPNMSRQLFVRNVSSDYNISESGNLLEKNWCPLLHFQGFKKPLWN